MLLKNHLFLLLATSVWLLPTMTNAREIDVRAGKVRVTASRQGNIYIDAGGRQLSVPPRRFSTGTGLNPVANPYLHQSLYTGCSGRSYLYQEINQINQSERGIVRTQSSTTYGCQ